LLQSAAFAPLFPSATLHRLVTCIVSTSMAAWARIHLAVPRYLVHNRSFPCFRLLVLVSGDCPSFNERTGGYVSQRLGIHSVDVSMACRSGLITPAKPRVEGGGLMARNDNPFSPPRRDNCLSSNCVWTTALRSQALVVTWFIAGPRGAGDRAPPCSTTRCRAGPSCRVPERARCPERPKSRRRSRQFRRRCRWHSRSGATGWCPTEKRRRN
jgi:hypothetical protein